MSDLDAALEPVRQILARRAAERSNGNSESERIKALLARATELLERPPAPASSTNGSVALDRATFDQNLADVREDCQDAAQGRSLTLAA